MLLTKDGVTQDVSEPQEIARLKRAGYVEAQASPPVEPEPEAEESDEGTPEEKNASALEEVNKKRLGSKKRKAQ